MTDTAPSRQQLDYWIPLDNDSLRPVLVAHVPRALGRSVNAGSSRIPTPVFTYASGTWGCGATDGEYWFQYQLDESWQSINIVTKELIPIILALALWAQPVQCDYSAIVDIVLEKDSIIMHMLAVCIFYDSPGYQDYGHPHCRGRQWPC